jgi:hypothetical protein
MKDFREGVEIMAKKTKVKDYDQFQLRLPPGMRDEINLASKRNDRSMNAEIIGRLQSSGDFIRDWFVGQALSGLLSNEKMTATHTVEELVSVALNAADAMLAARAPSTSKLSQPNPDIVGGDLEGRN